MNRLVNAYCRILESLIVAFLTGAAVCAATRRPIVWPRRDQILASGREPSNNSRA